MENRMSIEAMKQAVEAFEHIKKYVTDDGAMPENWDAYHEKEYFALEALRQAIEQAEKQEKMCIDCGKPTMHMGNKCYGCCQTTQPEQEPVAWVDKVWVERLDISKQLRMELLFSRCQLNNNQIPLYTAPPKREVDMSTKPEKIDTSAERVHETDKSVHDDDDIQEYKRPWVGLSDVEIATYSKVVNGVRLAREIEGLLRERNT
jgi:hypothetical protein